MLKRTPSQPRGLVVYVISLANLLYLILLHRYVDSQLRKSRRFDAEGIKKDHPDLFHPFPRRRGSSTSYSNASDFNSGEDEGQLRYWTPSMCSTSPHLFDFVVTVRRLFYTIPISSKLDPSWAETEPSSSLPGFSRRSFPPFSHLH